jgi:hypothetical protein
LLNRRDILKLAALTPAATASASALASQAFAAPGGQKPEIRRYRTLGKTGQKVSDLSLGGGNLSGPKVVARALQIGVTYIDTAPDYNDSEKIIGVGWKRSGVARDKFHITSKFCRAGSYPKHVKLGTSKEELIRLVEDSLKRLQTDYLDNLFVHALGERGPKDVARLQDPEILAAAEQLKKDGKIRFLGCSSHGPHKPLECLKYAIESGRYDVIMPAYNLYAWKGLDEVLRLAHEKGVGVIAMKTLRGAKQARRKGVLPKGNFAHAAFKWVWSNENVAGLVVTIEGIGKLERYARASGATLAYHERRELERMVAATSDSVCRIGCGDCLSHCPKGVQIPTVLRADMYYTEYADLPKARGEYGELTEIGASAASCATCTEETCLGACPYGVAIRDHLVAAHERLAFA